MKTMSEHDSLKVDRCDWTHFDVWVCVALIAAVLVVFWPARHFEFLQIDDPGYLSNNPQAVHGLTVASMRWAFSSLVLAHYMPVAVISSLAEVSIFGMNPGPLHVDNAILHAISAAGWYLLWTTLTGQRGRSAMVAALFALHPMRVEPVAWIVGRGDVLCMLCSVTSLILYVRFIRSGNRWVYILSLLSLVLAMLSKTIAMVVPGVMVLLNVWPLRRVELVDRWMTGGASGAVKPQLSVGRLIKELWPFFVIGAGGAALGLFGRVSSHTPMSLSRWSMADRVTNGFLGYCRYLAKVFWPRPMLVFYPLQTVSSAGPTLSAVALLGLLTALAVRLRRRRPYLLVGWLWFLWASLPTIGFVQSGGQSMADRYAYMPYIGLFVAMIWLIADVGSRLQVNGGVLGRLAIFAMGTVVVLACALESRRQLAYWQNTFSLFKHEVDFEPDVADADVLLADQYRLKKQFDQALYWYQHGLALEPDNDSGQTNLACLLLPVDARAALPHFEIAARLKPEDAAKWWNLGICQQQLNMAEQATETLSHARKLDPAIGNDNSLKSSQPITAQ